MKDSHLVALSYSFVEWANFSKLLNQDPWEAFIEVSRAGFSQFYGIVKRGCATATDMCAGDRTNNNTLTTMLEKLEEKGLVTFSQCGF